jgi:hypothetical protein
MSDALLKAVDGDMSLIPVASVKGNTQRDRVMKLMAHMLLRIWTRMALESGQKLSMSPSQYVLGSYDGQMRWALSESVDYKGISQLSVGGIAKRRYSLVAETYILKGDERIRLMFSLEEERVKNKPVYVNYLVFDAALEDFDLNAAIASLKPVLPKWLETILATDDRPLWDYCDAQLECVGI